MTRPLRPAERRTLTPPMRAALRRALHLELGPQKEPWVAGRYRRTAVALHRRGLVDPYQITPSGQTFYRLNDAGRALVTSSSKGISS